MLAYKKYAGSLVKLPYPFDTLNINEFKIRVAHFGRRVTDTEYINYIARKVSKFVRRVSKNEGISEVGRKSEHLNRIKTETINIQDVIIRAARFTRRKLETINVNESNVWARIWVKLIFKNIGITEIGRKSLLSVRIDEIINSFPFRYTTIYYHLSEDGKTVIEKGSNNLSYKSIIGALLFGLMILIIGLVSLRRVKDTDVGQKEKRKKDKVESAESGTGRISPGQDRRPSTRNGGSNLDGGGK
jgi:hypothetical protein